MLVAIAVRPSQQWLWAMRASSVWPASVHGAGALRSTQLNPGDSPGLPQQIFLPQADVTEQGSAFTSAPAAPADDSWVGAVGSRFASAEQHVKSTATASVSKPSLPVEEDHRSAPRENWGTRKWSNC